MAESIVDANVLIALFRGNVDLKDFLETLNCGVDTTVYVELIQGAKNKNEVKRIESALRTFPIIHFNEAVSRQTIRLIRSYSKSHGLLLADAMIAATCLVHDLDLVTFNEKDFKFISGLKVVVPTL